MLTLPIKEKWFDMILSGEKKEGGDMYIKCKYAVCQVLKNEEYPCPKDSGTDGERNGVCYSYCAFDKDNDGET